MYARVRALQFRGWADDNLRDFKVSCFRGAVVIWRADAGQDGGIGVGVVVVVEVLG